MELIFLTVFAWAAGWLFGLLIKTFIIDHGHPDPSPWQFAKKSGYYLAAFYLVLRLIEFVG